MKTSCLLVSGSHVFLSVFLFLLVLCFTMSITPRPLMVTWGFILAAFRGDTLKTSRFEVLTCPVLFHMCGTSTFFTSSVLPQNTEVHKRLGVFNK